MSTDGGQVAFPGNSMYHATKWGIEGFAESVAQEVAPFGIGMTIVEPGGARTEFRYGSAQVAQFLPTTTATRPTVSWPCSILRAGLPRRSGPDGRRDHRQRGHRARPIAHHPRVAGPADHVSVLKDRLAASRRKADLAASTDFPPGE